MPSEKGPPRRDWALLAKLPDKLREDFDEMMEDIFPDGIPKGAISIEVEKAIRKHVKQYWEDKMQ